ncbi:site-2 protease family protein [Cyanobium sp. HWJ4-Hawea]|uniref:site-2 protease family protein n=1 Tax=Cyanobium sp. HWJ4-Hawea TaxID=2823713 RepID=UPI0020CDCEFB|nr:site-2 protease family protein [Cyanobium sp. HWJ4-Hawea]MCP9809337.1 site-2 protease family protein [Cyanobium sp. HWJ4-Hawea]
MGDGWQVMTIRGIPLRVHPSWFVILVLATAAFSQQYAARIEPSISVPTQWGMGFVTALLLFVSVLLHELGHSLVALAQGVKVRSITLFLLGGVASVERECSSAMGALQVAVAGPAVSLVLGFALLAISQAAQNSSPLLGSMAGELGALNLVLGLFNLLPGLPLDGGLIVKALVWQFSGNQRRGVEVANSCGRFLAFTAIGLGALLIFKGSGLSGTWLILLGWFGLGAARNQSQLLTLQRLLQEMAVADAAGRRYRVLEANGSPRELSQIQLGEAKEMGQGDWLLVCDRGRWKGVIDDALLQQLPVQRWDTDRIGDHIKPLDSLPAIAATAPLWQAVQQLEDGNHSRLLVLSAAGLPCGTLERPELGAAVLARLGLKLPTPLLEMARRQNTYPLGLGLPQVVRTMVATGEVQAREATD